jgi:23S rRNA (uracil1939-C5)-methyltransferase
MYVNVNREETPYIFGRDTRHVAGPSRSLEQINGIDYLISATSFFQTNVDAAELLVRLVLEAAGTPRPGARAVDLFAGVGLFALQLARAGWQVLAVEENPSAISDGIASARENGLGSRRCQFLRLPVRRVEAWTRTLGNTPVDTLVLDPPRIGIGAALFRQILNRLQPRRVVYVSCDPASLASDLEALGSTHRASGRYAVESVRPVDMFPQTAHVEAVVKIERPTA